MLVVPRFELKLKLIFTSIINALAGVKKCAPCGACGGAGTGAGVGGSGVDIGVGCGGAAAADAAATRMGPFGLMSSWKGERRPSFCRAAIILMRERNLSPFLYP